MASAAEDDDIEVGGSIGHAGDASSPVRRGTGTRKS